MKPDPYTLSILESVLREEIGLNISSLGKNSIKKALSRRMETLSFENFYAYLSLLKKSTTEINAFIDEVAINETWFYRDETPFNELSKYAISALKKTPDNQIHLLSVPCATGEEPYSMAISLLEAGLGENQFSIDAIDISSRSLSIARKGIYRKNSFRGRSKRFQRRYFDNAPHETYAIKDTVKQQVHFMKANLLNLSHPLVASSYDVIFCRNLLIYLDLQFHKHVIDTLWDHLNDNGILFVGHSESGLFIDSQFKSNAEASTFSFIKKSPILNNTQPEHDDIQTEASVLSADDQEQTASRSSHFSIQNQSKSSSEARASTQRGDYAKAIAIYEAIIHEKGPSADLFFLMAKNYYERCEFTNSISTLKKAIYLDPDLLEAIDLLAQIYKILGDEQNYQSFSQRSKRVKQRLSEKV